MTLVERRRTIYFRAENSNVAEQERYNKPGLTLFVWDCQILLVT